MLIFEDEEAPVRIELEWLATEVIAELPTAQARTEVRSLIVDVLRHPDQFAG
ncbi:hypothetical protein OG763_03265 [Streptomyces sp. NBC_01230]|uniref:hypothetical protein n=1 Tax=Streptomyces sp. NBC_01230 TaxID=2903784 RepID=UPI002E15A0B1|nr:hypothetical protein OG763_03265 [Streptomyces sp. NBC_01230]